MCIRDRSEALDNGEFVVYLQPKLHLRDKAIAGAEALIRWDDPAKGLIPPDSFIPLFEKNGFIVNLDLYVFEQVDVYKRQRSSRARCSTSTTC